MLNLPKSRNKEAGFTLIEIIVVTVVMCLIMTIAGTTLISWQANFQLRGAGDDLVSDLQKAKMYAIKNNIDVLFTFTPVGTCPGGGYEFKESGSGDVVASKIWNEDICLSNSTFVAGAGFTVKGLAATGVAGTVNLKHEEMNNSGDVMYTITQTPAGGISSDRTVVP